MNGMKIRYIAVLNTVITCTTFQISNTVMMTVTTMEVTVTTGTVIGTAMRTTGGGDKTTKIQTTSANFFYRAVLNF